VDAFMDMARTSINVVGNCLASVVLARWDGSFDVAPEVDSQNARRIALQVAESPGR
jgi:proton glutamate symport protein